MIMGGTHNLIIKRAGCIIVCVLIFVQSASAQPGFVSIACCAESEFTERNDINCTSDHGLFPLGISCRDVKGAAANDTANFKVRNFHFSSGKICYNLSTTKGQDYLLRSSFISDDFVVASTCSFDVLIGSTPISVVNSSRYLEVVEGIFRATNQDVDFCLGHRLGDPFISQVELRPLNDSKYLQGNASGVLRLVSRIDAGNAGDSIRYPDDTFDRIWRSPNPQAVSPSLSISNASVHVVDAIVPTKVLQTALTHRDRLEFLHSDLGRDDKDYTMFLYFYELNDTVRPGERVFNIYVNNELRRERFDILINGSNYVEASLRVRAIQSLNLTLARVRTDSDFGPILNAYEILQMETWLQGSNQQDVGLMMNARDELQRQNKENEVLQSWSGDPCLPTPWKGLACDKIGASSVISKLDISSSLLRGPLPTSIPNLPYLKELNLSHNDFTDKIPRFLHSSKLVSVDLSHNNLTGFLPESLLLLPDLTKLYYGCNPHFSSEIPSSFNRPRLATDNGTCDREESRSGKSGFVIGTVACGSVVVTVAIGLTFAAIRRRKYRANGKFGGKKQYPMTTNAVFAVNSKDDIILESITIQMLTLDSIENATQKYKTLIGEGGFGSVYRGMLSDGQDVAVKVRSSTSTQGTREFENELNLLSSIRHENLMPLLGYCRENDQQILVYPFMSNGSLQDRLYGEAAKRKILDWPTRLSIALGAARGLTYLHTCAGRCVIHRDVKSSNILLDHSMNAKVADFGFSKYAPQEGDSSASLEVRGTAGYLDPEYYSTQHLSAKSDVFSFGVLLLEIVSGREPLNIHRPQSEWSLVEWAKPYIRDSKIDEIVDPNIKGGYHVEAMWRVVEVALACIEPFSAYRPCMADIVRELEDALIIENNASEYMKSIDSLGGSNRFSIGLDKKTTLPPPAPTPPEPSPINEQALALPEPRYQIG